MRCGAVRSMQSEAVVLIVEISVNRQERQSTDSQQGGGKGLQWGYQKKMSEDGAFDTELRDECGSEGQTGEVRFWFLPPLHTWTRSRHGHAAHRAA